MVDRDGGGPECDNSFAHVLSLECFEQLSIWRLVFYLCEPLRHEIHDYR